MADDQAFLVCTGCGDRIGVYERLWLQLDDGATVASSYLNLPDHVTPGRARVWHLGCLTTEAIKSPGDPASRRGEARRP